MTYAPDPTWSDPGLGWTEQNKNSTEQSEQPATASEPPAPQATGRPARGRPPRKPRSS